MRCFGVWETAVSRGAEKERSGIQTSPRRETVAGHMLSRLRDPTGHLATWTEDSPAPRRQRTIQQKSVEPMVETDTVLAKHSHPQW